VEHRAPDPGVDLNHGEDLEPSPHSILTPDTTADLLQPAEVDPEVRERREDRDGFLERAEAVERPFPVDYKVSARVVNGVIKEEREMVAHTGATFRRPGYCP
jgi:hypothetical protein